MLTWPTGRSTSTSHQQLDCYVEDLAGVNAAPISLKAKSLITYSSFVTSMSTEMEVVINYRYLPGAQNETIVKEVRIVAENLVQPFHFQRPYRMEAHNDHDNGISLDDENIPYI